MLARSLRYFLRPLLPSFGIAPLPVANIPTEATEQPSNGRFSSSRSGTRFDKSIKPAEEKAARIQTLARRQKHRQSMTKKSVATLREGGES